MTDWLFRHLRGRATHRGLVIAREAVLLQELGCEPATLRGALAELEQSDVVEILAPLPFLVLKLAHSWSGKRSAIAESPEKSPDSEPSRYSYSFNNQAIDKSHAIAGENGGAGEGEELIEEILATLGEPDPTTFRGVLTHYPEAVIRSVLARIRRMPPERVRKSKTAYFRFLLAKTTK